jgi:hypothetical protein
LGPSSVLSLSMCGLSFVNLHTLYYRFILWSSHKSKTTVKNTTLKAP